MKKFIITILILSFPYIAFAKNNNNNGNGNNTQVINGVDGKDGQVGATGKGLKDRYNVLIGVEHEGKKWKQSIHGGYDVNNNTNILEIRFTRKIGKSYTEERLDDLQKQINELKEEQIKVVPCGKNCLKIDHN